MMSAFDPKRISLAALQMSAFGSNVAIARPKLSTMLINNAGPWCTDKILCGFS
jgi:hypothetical protein